MGVNELLLIVGVILVSGGLVWAFRSSASGAAFTFMGVSALDRSRYAAIDSQTLLFWAIAVLIVLFIGYSSRKSDVVPNLWKNYIVGGARGLDLRSGRHDCRFGRRCRAGCRGLRAYGAPRRQL